jgi:hypothetical protein
MRPTGAQASEGFSAPIDALIDRAGGALAAHARRARARWRESDPLARLGLDIIFGALREIAEARAIDVLEQLPAVSAGEWWLAPGATNRAGVVVVAADGALVCVDARPAWDRAPGRAAAAATALLGLFEDRRARATAVIALDGARATTRSSLSGEGRSSAIASIEELPGLVACALDGRGHYRPAGSPRLARALHDARSAGRQRTRAMVGLLDELDRSWVLAAGVRLPGLVPTVGVLALGSGGAFVCQPAGVDAALAASEAVLAARRLAALSRGTGVHFTPVVLGDPGSAAHQLELCDDGRAWALPVDRVATWIATVARRGITGAQLRRLRRPAPGWEYRLARRSSGWSYEIRYNLRTHERPEPSSGS